MSDTPNHGGRAGLSDAPEARPWVALVGPEVEENLSLRYLAAALDAAGTPSRIIAFDSWSGFSSVARSIPTGAGAPAVVALSLSFQWRARDFLALAVDLRQRGYRGHITAGGHFGTFAWEELLRDFPELDSLCIHEAEETLPCLVQAVAAGRPIEGLPGVASRDAQGRPARGPLRAPPDLAALPWPDRRGAPATCLGHPIAPLVSSRGCYAKCHFCCIAEWHEMTLPGRRYRSRPLDDVAAEMVSLQRERGIEIFVFHDDNFLVPGRAQSLARVHALADALERRGVGRFATVVKARPSDVDEELFGVLKERLGLVRLYLGVESDSAQGLETLGRRVTREENHRAMARLRALDLYVCYNLLLFDPDAGPEELEENLAFIEAHADVPMNFGRVELYAGTPLLRRMRAEGRCAGDYLGWDYRLRDDRMQRLFETSMRCFYDRNFAAGSLANRLMGTRFDAEVARRFHPGCPGDDFVEASRALSRALAHSSVAALRELLAFTAEARGPEALATFEGDLRRRLRAEEGQLGAAASTLEREIRLAVGSQRPPRPSRTVPRFTATAFEEGP